MSKLSVLRWSLCCSFVFRCATATAQEVLYAQEPNQFWGYTSDTLWLNSDDIPWSSLRADSFQLATDESLCGIDAWGFYGAVDPEPGPYITDPPATETMRVRFYADAAGFPGALVREQTFIDPPRIATGETVLVGPIRDEFRYSFNLAQCLPAAAGTTYWLEITQLGDIDSRWKWEESSMGDSLLAFQWPIGSPWVVTPSGDLAFELRSIPEPVSALLTGIGLCAVALGRGARAARRRS